MRKILVGIFVAMLCIPFLGKSQTNISIFPDKTGTELLDALAAEYRPIVVEEYGPARDILYGEVYFQNDSVEGIYSGHKIFLPQNVDPSTFLFMNGVPNGINAEHSYPQSKGAGSGNARSDMHHLFPCRVAVNEGRSAFPFGNIADTHTTSWFRNTSQLVSMPTVEINAYSERIWGLFEPRESVKGNIARAVFYFYTMYKLQADFADPTFFERQRPTLCLWHNEDPVDSLEWERTWRIAKYQEDKPNPYILDCTLISRTFCQNTPGGCATVSSAELPAQEISPVTVFPNPSAGLYRISSKAGISAYFVLDNEGSFVVTKHFESEQDSFEISLNEVASGTYRLILELEKGYESKSLILTK